MKTKMEIEAVEKKYLSFEKNVEDVLRSSSSKHAESMKKIKSDISKMKDEIRNFESRISEKCSCNEDLLYLKTTITTLEDKANPEDKIESMQTNVNT